MSENQTDAPVRLTPADQLDREVKTVASSATDADHKVASATGVTGAATQKAKLSAAVAAVIFTTRNRTNRNLSVSKVRNLAEAIKRGEWKYSHQGIAFYSDGTLADGQHRCAAIALSGQDVEVMVSSDFDPSAIDVIDAATPRTAGDALQMAGVENGKLKAKLAKDVLRYEAKMNGDSTSFTVQQIEEFARANDTLLNDAIDIGRASTENVTDPSMKGSEAQTLAAIMLYGKWSMDQVVAFIAATQQGIAASPDAPTLLLSKRLIKAKLSDRRKDALNSTDKVAICLKAAHLWYEDKSVSRLDFKGSKEALPSMAPPVHLPDGVNLQEAVA